MSSHKPIKVVFDTNIWISFLIGKKLHSIVALISSQQLLVILSDQLLVEIQTVTERPKIRKYFSEQKLTELIQFLSTVGQVYKHKIVNKISRDPKDNFLLDLIDASEADYLVTGDKDLLVLNTFKNAKILTPLEFETEIRKIRY